MSDIAIKISWVELFLFSPVVGWPGMIAGGAMGALIWRKRPIIGGAFGAVLGNLAYFFGTLFIKSGGTL
jgi:hypothetical protein